MSSTIHVLGTGEVELMVRILPFYSWASFCFPAGWCLLVGFLFSAGFYFEKVRLKYLRRLVSDDDQWVLLPDRPIGSGVAGGGC